MPGLAQLLQIAIQAFISYKEARDRAIAAGEVTAQDGTVKSDAELIDLFQQDAERLRDHAAELEAKYGGA